MSVADQHHDSGAHVVTTSTVSSLIDGARAGCDHSMGQLAERYRRYLLLVANTEISTNLQAKIAPSDLVQETFMHAGQSFGRFTGASERELLAWLRRILHFRALNAARRFDQVAARRVGRELPLVTGAEGGRSSLADRSPTPCAQILADEDRAALDRALGRLSEDDRSVILLRALERKSFADIAARLSCSAEAARKRWVRALAQLRHQWGRND
jgi:RNA polymerase sigma-70 factor (ECF subfamily)